MTKEQVQITLKNNSWNLELMIQYSIPILNFTMKKFKHQEGKIIEAGSNKINPFNKHFLRLRDYKD